MTKERLKEVVDNYICFYDLESVNEFHEDVLYMDSGNAINFDEINLDYFFIYEQEQYNMSSDIREFIKIINKCKKELNKFENGKSFFGLMKLENDLLMTEEALNELFDFNNLEASFNALEYCKFNILKGII